MAMFENFPYTNLHDLNLDWVLQTVRELSKEWLETREEWEGLREYVENYFKNLDVSEEINRKINDLISTGEFATIITPTITDVVSEWLTKHITPTSPALDNTLSVSGAAAESSAVGAKTLQTFDNTLNSNDDLDNVTKSGTYYTGSTTPAHTPEGAGGRLLVLSTTSGLLSRCVQVFFAFTGRVYHRFNLGNVWNGWYEITRLSDLESAIQTTVRSFDKSLNSDDDLDNVTKSGTYYTGATLPAHTPEGAGGRLLVLSTTSGLLSRCVQVFFAFTGRVYHRFYLGNVWNGWYEISRSSDVINNSFFETSSISLFSKVTCIGDSFTAGYLYNKNDSPFYDPDYVPNGVYPEVSYPAVMSRLYGLNVTNRGVSGATSKAILDNTLPKIIADDPQDLYIISLGLNDKTQGVPVGVISDIDSNTNSLVGNVGKIIKALTQKSPHGKIVLVKSLWVYAEGTTIPNAYYKYISDATEILSEHFAIPYIETKNDAYFGSAYYNNNFKGLHPTGPLYAGIGKRLGELIGKCIEENNDYFFNYYPASYNKTQ